MTITLTTRAAAVLAAISAMAMASPAAAQDALPDGPGKAETINVCSQCHEAQKAE